MPEWTKERLQELVRTRLGDYRFLVVSNREPYFHSFRGEEVVSLTAVSGLVTALDPVMQACGGVWVAHGSGDADRVVANERSQVAVPPSNPSYTLRRVWLTKEQEDGYYYGFANEALWPLCHIAYVRPNFNEGDWNHYKEVNELFAEAVLDEVGDGKAFVFIQDYHLTLLPRLLRERNPSLILAQFWHIPWPNPENFRICPWAGEILGSLLSNDLIAVHIRYHRNNFLECVDQMLESRIDYERFTVHRGGHSTRVRYYPISVDFQQIDERARSAAVEREMERIKGRWGLDSDYVGIGIDRFDYTKGIPQRLQALDRLLARYPRLRRRLVFFQIGEPSRMHIKEYRDLNAEVEALVEAINWQYGVEDWKPVILIKGESLSQVTLQAFHRLADFCVVNSLHDGMNLVAKEFVSSRFDEDGVLILSRFTGAARELEDALLVNPYAPDEMARAMHAALEMPRSERRLRMKKMREVVSQNNIYRWAGEIIQEIANIEFRVP